MTPKLTSRQRVVRFLIHFQATYGYPPTPQEIARGMNYNCVDSVRYHLKALKAAGTIEWDGGKGRSVRLVG